MNPVNKLDYIFDRQRALTLVLHETLATLSGYMSPLP